MISRRTTLVVLALVLLGALGLRLFVLSRAAMISRDGTTFIWYAQGLSGDPHGEISRQRQHPLYPAMVLGAHRVVAGVGQILPHSSRLNDPVLSWQTAGLCVTLLGGLAAIVGVYALTRALFAGNVATLPSEPAAQATGPLTEPGAQATGPPFGAAQSQAAESRARVVALIAAILAAGAAEFCQLSADVLTDMPHLAIYLFALAMGIAGLRRRSLVRLAAAGGLSGIAYLIRPEGAEPAVALAAVVLLGTRWPVGTRLKACVAVTVTALAFAGPYMLLTGKLVQKKSIGQLVACCSDAPTKTQRFGAFRTSSEECGKHDATIAQPFKAGNVSRSPLRESRRDDGSPGFTLSPWDGGQRPAAVLAGFGLAMSADSAVAPLRAVGLVLEDWVRCLRVTLLIPAVAWLVLAAHGRRTNRRRTSPLTGAQSPFSLLPPVGRIPEIDAALGWKLLVAAGLLHLAIAVLLIVRFDYWQLFSLRHVVVLAGMTLPLSAAGVMASVDLIRTQRRTLLTAAILIGLIAPTARWMFEARFADEAYLRQAGEWIRARQSSSSSTRPRVLTTRNQVAFYANGVLMWAPLDADFERYLTEARVNRPAWLVFDERRLLRMSPTFFAGLLHAAGPGELSEAAHFEQRNRRGVERAVVYRYNPGS